jgi:hypothetical protein
LVVKDFERTFAEFKNVPNDQKKRIWTGNQFVKILCRRKVFRKLESKEETKGFTVI